MTLAFLTAVVIALSMTVLLYARHNRSLRANAERADHRFALLQQIAPSLTTAVLDSTAATCARILDRIGALVPARTLLCFYEADGRLLLGAKAGDGFAGFLREGTRYDGDSIIGLAFESGIPVTVGPAAVHLPTDVAMIDAGTLEGRAHVGPAAGSRDRVWALAAPLCRARGHGLAPQVVGIVYLERPLSTPFLPDEVRTIDTVARLAADALERARFADVMRRGAQIDGLTGLMTPAAFRARLRDEVAARRDVALFFIDSDRFKLFNDTHGHAAGDALLRRLAATFSDIASRSGGFAGRNGGDEFCIALPDRTKDAAVEIAERVRAAVDALGDGAAVKVTVSIGVAHHPVDLAADETAGADRLLEIADELMYEAKRAGRNRVEFLRLRAAPRRAVHPGEGPIPRR